MTELWVMVFGLGGVFLLGLVTGWLLYGRAYREGHRAGYALKRED